MCLRGVFWRWMVMNRAQVAALECGLCGSLPQSRAAAASDGGLCRHQTPRADHVVGESVPQRPAEGRRRTRRSIHKLSGTTKDASERMSSDQGVRSRPIPRCRASRFLPRGGSARSANCYACRFVDLRGQTGFAVGPDPTRSLGSGPSRLLRGVGRSDRGQLRTRASLR
jgi:hypothetical protein